MVFEFYTLFGLLATFFTNVEGTVTDDNLNITKNEQQKSNMESTGYLMKFLVKLEAERMEEREQYNNMKRRLEELTKKMSQTQTKLSALEKLTAKQPNVAFYVWLANENTAQNRVIKYDRIVTNIGNGYSVSTGRFVAPVSGTYVFAVTVSDKRGPAHLNIMKNNIEVGAVRSERTGDLDLGTQVVVLSLEASDNVYMKNHINHGLHSHGGRYAFNTFSGFLIR